MVSLSFQSLKISHVHQHWRKSPHRIPLPLFDFNLCTNSLIKNNFPRPSAIIFSTSTKMRRYQKYFTNYQQLPPTADASHLEAQSLLIFSYHGIEKLGRRAPFWRCSFFVMVKVVLADCFSINFLHPFLYLSLAWVAGTCLCQQFLQALVVVGWCFWLNLSLKILNNYSW